MNFLDFHGSLRRGSSEVRLGDGAVRVPEIHEDMGDRELILGVRPEDVRFVEGGGLRGEVFGAEYLGTTQIITLTTLHGTLRARLPADVNLSRGERIGLGFRAEKLSLFDKATGRAVH